MNPIHTSKSFTTTGAPDGVSETDLARAEKELAGGVSANISLTAARLLGAGSTVSNSTATNCTAKDLDRIVKSMPPPVAAVMGVTTRPDSTANIKACVELERANTNPTLWGVLEFPVTELVRQQEAYKVFTNRDEYLRHVALLSLEVGDLVKNVRRGFSLRSGCGAYDDAVVALLEPFTLISREGDMMWSATIMPEYFQKIGRADDASLKAVEKRIERDLPARWNGEKCKAKRGTVIVGKSPVETWWCAKMVGQRIRVVRVEYRNDVEFIDDEDGSGSRKVFATGGGPFSAGHRTVPVDDESTFISAFAPAPPPPLTPEQEQALAKLRAHMEMEDDVKRIVQLVPEGDRFRYLIETPFRTFPQAVIGTTDAAFVDVRIEVKCSSLRCAEQTWARGPGNYGADE